MMGGGGMYNPMPMNYHTQPSSYGSAMQHPTPPLSKGSLSPPSTTSGGGTPSVSPIPESHYPSGHDWLGLQSQHQQYNQVRISPPPAPTGVLMQDWSHLLAPRPNFVHPQLAPPDLTANTMRVGIPLKSLPGSTTSVPSAKRTSVTDRDDGMSDESGKSPSPPSTSRLYPLLKSGDPAFKLPAIRGGRRTASSRESTVSPPSSPGSCSSKSPSPAQPTKPALPSLASLSLAEGYQRNNTHTPVAPLREISLDDRIQHAELIRSMLVLINKQWMVAQQQQATDEDSDSDASTEDDEESRRVVRVKSEPRDVEMTAIAV